MSDGAATDDIEIAQKLLNKAIKLDDNLTAARLLLGDSYNRMSKYDKAMEIYSSALKQAEELGAGEILITAIDKDGSLEGYDDELNSLVSEGVNIPVLVAGGAGKWQDFVDGIRIGKASAVCTTNIYHFTENSISSAKQFMKQNNIHVRV